MTNEDSSKDGHIEKPIATIKTTEHAGGLSVGEWQKLLKQDPSTLTPSQQKALAQANDSLSKVTNSISSGLASFGKAFSPTVDLNKILPEIKRVNFSIPKFSLPPVEAYKPIELNHVSNTTMVDNQIKQTALLEKMVQAQSQQKQNSDLMKLIEPRYDRKKRIITFANTQIKLIADSDNEIICKKLFWDGRPVRRPVEKGDIMELLGTTDKKSLYNKVASLNKLVDKETGVEKLFDFVDKKLWFNTKYVELPL